MTMRIGIVLASLALCGALFWSGSVLVALMMEWLVAYPWVAKAMAALPMLVLSLMAVTIVGLVPDATAALLLFLAGYAAANLTAFGAVIHLRGRTAIEDYAGFAGRRPFTAAALALALLSLVGVPPLAGFVGKLLLFKTTIAAGYAWLAAIAVANTVISLFYYLRVLARMYFGERGGNARILGGWSGAALAIGAVGVTGIGIFAGLVLAAF